jgi:hypothetical protein
MRGINEVFVHPDAQDWFLSSVKELLRAFNLKLMVTKGVCGNNI